MRFLSKCCLVGAFCCLPFLLPAQLKLPAGFSLADSSQTHVLTTRRGDLLIGRCVGWSGDSISFLSVTQDLLSFSLDSVAQLATLDQARDFGQYGLFRITTKDNRPYEGFPKRYDGKRLVFRVGRNDQESFALDEIASMELIPASSSGKLDTITNTYKVRSGPIRPRTYVGRLIGFWDSKFILLRPGQPMPDSISGRQVARMRYLKPYHEAFGHERSSLFVPTGFNLKKGQRQFRSMGLYVFNAAAYGVTDHFSVSLGGVGYLPYFDGKLSHHLGDYLHGSLGAFTVLGVNYGFSAAVSLGTPDYFLNFSYAKSLEYDAAGSGFNFDVFSFMASVRIGNRQRVFVEYDFLNEPTGDGGFRLTNEGYRVALTGGIGWYKKRTHLELGWMLTGPADISFRCGSIQGCSDRAHYTPLPVLTFGSKLRGKKTRDR